MCLKDLLDELKQRNVKVSATQVRWAITSEAVSRPPLDGSLRFDFGEEHVVELLNHFSKRLQQAVESAEETVTQ